MFRKILILSFVAAFLVGCNTKFSVNGEYEEKAIVHFILDQGQEYQFLKLNKTFLQEGDALEFAKNPELSYFDQVEAIVEEVVDGSVERTWTLQDTIISNKKDGVFYGPDQKLYFFKEPIDTVNGKPAYSLRSDALYRLKINIDNGKFFVSGQTRLITDINIKSPKEHQALNFVSNNINATEYTGTSISFDRGNGSSFKMQLQINYVEYTSSADSSHHSILWDLGTIDRAEMPSATGTFSAQGEAFYTYVKAKIPVKPEVQRRNIRGVDVILTAASEDLHTYILSNQPASTLAQNKPMYSNLDGALGIFSSRLTVRQRKVYYNYNSNGRALSFYSTRELCTGPYTAALKFCTDITVTPDAGSNFACP